MRSLYYDRQGKPLQLRDWARLFEDVDERRVSHTTLPDGKWVSTVWLGLDHSHGYGPPLIFETMVFAEGEPHATVIDSARYSTEEEARAGHAAMVTKWLAGGDTAPTGRA